MRRREFITGLGGAALAGPACAQTRRGIPVIGFVNTGSATQFASLVQAFLVGLAELGYVDGRNVAIEYRWAGGRYERLPELVGDLVSRDVQVIAATGGSPAPLAAKAASGKIPVVFQIGIDPVAIGLVQSLSRPGGNVTGATMLSDTLHKKRLELLLETVPGRSSFAMLGNRKSPGYEGFKSDTLAAANVLRKDARIYEAGEEGEIEARIGEIARDGATPLVISGDPLFNTVGGRLGELTLRHRLPAVYQFKPFVENGGMMSYGGSLVDAYRIAGTYAGRVLNGERPADLPIQQSTKIELLINLKTAKALGIEVPTSILLRADEVIE